MEKLTNDDFKIIDACPWEEDKENIFTHLYYDNFGCEVVKCKKCGIVFARKRLNETGLKKYWDDYLSRVHIHNPTVVKQRQSMYKIDYNFINTYIKKGNVLDVGCGRGDFLTFFENAGFIADGVEFGKEAAVEAKKSHTIYYGEFPKIKFNKKYDLIIFRGVLQYVPEAKAYLNKAINLLKDNGYLFITAQPNVESLCFRLFKDKFTQPVSGSDFIGYSEKIFTRFFFEKGLQKVGEKYFYEETPYANLEDDILKVAKAIEIKRSGGKIDFISPAFYGNMMSLVYRKKDI